MHSRLIAATSFTKLHDAAVALGIGDALDASIPAMIEELPRKEAWATTMLTALAGRWNVKSLRELLQDRRPEAWLFSHGRERANEVLALVRRYLAIHAQRAGVDDGGSARAKPPPSVPMWPLTEEALVGWARENNVEEYLDDPISAAIPNTRQSVRHVAYGALGRHRMRYVLVPAALGQSGVSDRALETAEQLESELSLKEVDLLRELAWTYLSTRAAEVKSALEEERELRAKLVPPEEPGARRLFDELMSARIDARSKVTPRPRAMIGDARLTVMRTGAEDGQIVIHHQEPETGARPYPSRLRPNIVTIAIDPYEELRIRATCPCTSGAYNACVHALAALDRLLGALAKPGIREDESTDRDLLEPVVDLVRKPRWSRALASLDRVALREERRQERADEQRLWWQLQPGLGGLEIQPCSQQRGKRGDFLKPKPIPLDRLAKSPELWTLPQDAKVIELLSAVPNASKSYAHVRRALKLLVGHPRVYYEEDHEHPLSLRLSGVEIGVDEDGAGGIVLSPRLDVRELDRAELAALAADAGKSDMIVKLDVELRRCVLIVLDDEQRALLTILARHGYHFPAEAKDELLRRLPALGKKLPIAIPPALAKSPASADDRLFFRMEPEDVILRVDAFVRPIPNGPSLPPGEGPGEVLGAMDNELVSARRDLERERTRLAHWLPRLELAPNDEPPHYTWVLPLERALALLERLRDATAPGAEGETQLAVEWPKGQAWKVSRRAGTGDLKVVVSDKKDWFGLEGEIEVDGTKVALGLLLEAARRNRAFVQVASGAWVAIADELRDRLSRVRDVVFESRSALEVAPAAALALEELVEHAGALNASQRFRTLLDEIRHARDIDPVPSRALAAELRDYQLAGYKWLARLSSWGAGACLADDMGLGKTLQALALLIDRGERGPALVVAPTSVCFNWARETARFAPSLRPVLYRTLGERDLSGIGANDVLIASYGLLARDSDAFAAVPFATLIVDEAQAIKNFATQRARAVRRIDAAWKLALTGTPVENHLGELWSIFRAINPGLLGSWEWFRDYFAAPIERDKDADRRRALARTIRPFILRRTKREVLAELPPRTEIELDIQLSRDERKLYDSVRLAALAELEEIGTKEAAAKDAAAQLEGTANGAPSSRRFQVLAAITRLRLLACHPALYDERSALPSAKLGRFLELVAALREEGHRALVFSQFTKHLALVRRALDERGVSYLYLDGSTPAADRERLVDRFQRGDVELFLISLKAGGTGLNLTAADYVIHLDPWWNPAVEDQATDRAHRIGQVRPVTVYRLVARGTIEEAMVALHAEKRELVRELLEGADAAAKVTTDELIRLIREGGFGGGDEAEQEAELEADRLVTEDPGATARE